MNAEIQKLPLSKLILLLLMNFFLIILIWNEIILKKEVEEVM